MRIINIKKAEPALGGISIEYTDCFEVEGELKSILTEMDKYPWGKAGFENIVKTFSRYMAKLWKVHPFRDGNGRMGRMWHTLLLSKWKDFFAWLPVETLIHERQNDYYQAINNSNTNGESTIFVEFMLDTIRDALFELINSENKNNVGINVGVNVGIKNNNLEDKLFSIISSNPELTAKELSIAVSLTQRQVERIISKLKEKGKIERVGAKKNGYWKINRDS